MTFCEISKLYEEQCKKDFNFGLKIEVVMAVHDNFSHRGLSEQEHEHICAMFYDFYLNTFDKHDYEIDELVWQAENLLSVGEYETLTTECLNRAMEEAERIKNNGIL